jgi:hypothetical protein
MTEFTFPALGGPGARYQTRENLQTEVRRAIAAAVDPVAAELAGVTTGTTVVGGWDASSGSFPTTRPDASAIEVGDLFVVTTAGTSDSVSFATGDRLIALAATGGATYSGNWIKAALPADVTPTGESQQFSLPNVTTRILRSDTTLDIAASGGDFQLLSEAMDDLRDWVLDAELTLQFAAETFTETETIFYDHQYGSRLTTLGADPLELTFSSLVSINSHSAGDHSVSWAVSDVTGCVVGGYLGIRGITGSVESACLEGTWKITSIDVGNNRITVKITDQRLAFATSVTVSSVSVMIYYRTRLVADGVSAITVLNRQGDGSAGNRGIGNLVIEGDGTAGKHGIVIEPFSLLTKPLNTELGIVGFARSGVYALDGAMAYLTRAMSCGNTWHGFSGVMGSHIQNVDGVANGNVLVGDVTTGGTIAATGSVRCGNGQGSENTGGSYIGNNRKIIGNTNDGDLMDGYYQVNGSTYEYNGDCGLRSRYARGNASGITAQNNNTGATSAFADIKAEKGGGGNLGTDSVYGTSQPAVGMFGDDGGVWHTATLSNNNVAETLRIGSLTGGRLELILDPVVHAHAFGTFSGPSDWLKSTTATVTGVDLDLKWHVSLGRNIASPNGVMVWAEVTDTDEVTIYAWDFLNSGATMINQSFNIVCSKVT